MNLKDRLKKKFRELSLRLRDMVLALSEDPHGNARALAWGTLISVIPGIGAMAVVLLAGWVRRERRLAFISSVTILNFYTIPPFYLASYRLGCWLMAVKPMRARTLMHRLEPQLLMDTRDFQFFLDYLTPFGVGLAICGMLLAVLVYTVAFPVLKAWGRRRIRKGALRQPPLMAEGEGLDQTED